MGRVATPRWPPPHRHCSTAPPPCQPPVAAVGTVGARNACAQRVGAGDAAAFLDAGARATRSHARGCTTAGVGRGVVVVASRGYYRGYARFRIGVPPEARDPLFRVYRGRTRALIFSAPRHCDSSFFRARALRVLDRDTRSVVYSLNERVILPKPSGFNSGGGRKADVIGGTYLYTQ